MSLINFFVAGAQKAGTTALDMFLRSHPNIQMAAKKELHIFDNEKMDWSNPDYTPFMNQFDWSARNVIRGEATPSYVYWPSAMERLHAYNPDAKIIVALRHPSFRAFSQWRQTTKNGRENLQFSDAIRPLGRQRLTERSLRAIRSFSYVERGLYAGQIRRLFELFPRNHILFFRTDLLWQDPLAVLNGIETFLGVDRRLDQRAAYIVPKVTGAPGIMAKDDRTYLDKLFADDIKMTAQLSDLVLEDWLNPDYIEPMKD